MMLQQENYIYIFEIGTVFHVSYFLVKFLNSAIFGIRTVNVFFKENLTSKNEDNNVILENVSKLFFRY